MDESDEIQFGPEQLIARLPCTWSGDGSGASLASPLPADDSLLLDTGYEPAAAAPPPRAAPPRMSIVECTEENVQAALDSFKAQSRSMFGCHEEAAGIGITGDIALDELDGPIVVLTLSGRFWHKRETVMRNAGAFLMRAIPEIADVVPSADEDLLDCIYDEETVRAPSLERAFFFARVPQECCAPSPLLALDDEYISVRVVVLSCCRAVVPLPGDAP